MSADKFEYRELRQRGIEEFKKSIIILGLEK